FVCELFGEDLTEDERRRRQRQINHMLAKGRIPARKAGRLWIGSRRRVRDHFAAGDMPIDETARGGYGVTDEKGTGRPREARPLRAGERRRPIKENGGGRGTALKVTEKREGGGCPRGGLDRRWPADIKNVAAGSGCAMPTMIHRPSKEKRCMSKPEAAKFSALAETGQIADPFAPENLRLSQSFSETMAVRKVLTTVPVRKPNAQDFVRVHPSPEFREDFPIIELKDEREEYIVTRNLVPELMSDIVSKTLFTAINRQGTLFFWPVRLPGLDGKDLDWWRSGREAAELAMTSWVRVKANMSLGAYDIFKAES